jgi:hypothetical protein
MLVPVSLQNCNITVLLIVYGWEIGFVDDYIKYLKK